MLTSLIKKAIKWHKHWLAFLHHLWVLEDSFHELWPLKIKLSYNADHLHMIDHNLVECRSIISLDFCSINCWTDKKNDNDSNEKENSHNSQNIPSLVWTLSTFKVWSSLICNITVRAENSLVTYIALSC